LRQPPLCLHMHVTRHHPGFPLLSPA
jgi:hypothetical protein